MLERAFAGLGLGSTRPTFFGQPVRAPQILQRRAPLPLQIEAAHKKGGGSTKNGRDSNSQRRGVKVWGGQAVRAGGIIIRQLGTAVHPGPGVGLGKDFTLYALQEGVVVFKRNKYIKRVTVVPFAEYVRPEGQQRKEGSRKMRRKQLYSPRNLEEQQSSAAVGVATVAAL